MHHRVEAVVEASMKVPARRRGNIGSRLDLVGRLLASMKVPARRRGNIGSRLDLVGRLLASMKVPARRRGNVAIEEYNGAVPYKPQ